MRIISKFTDYYDCMQAYEGDSDTTWIRNPEQIELKLKFDYINSRYSGVKGHFDWESRIIGFCGKIYSAIIMYYSEVVYHSKIGDNHNQEAICYNVEGVDQFVHAHGSKKEITAYNEKKTHGKWYMSRYGGLRDAFVKHFKKIEEKQNNYKDFFVEHKCPIFVTHNGSYKEGDTVIFHGRENKDPQNDKPDYCYSLKELEFYRVFDIYLAYQEICMYLGGILGASNPIIPAVSDKDMIMAKGFDKFSFRKESGKKKRGKKK